MNERKILYIGHSYHQKTKSTEFFISILQRLGEVSFIWDDSWITHRPLTLNNKQLRDNDLIVVFQQLGAARSVPARHRHKMVFIPMYDAMAHAAPKVWRRLRGTKVLCFSRSLYFDALNRGVEAFFVQYYPATPTNPPNKSFEDLKLFFWQRLAEPNWQSIQSALDIGQFKKINLHAAVDPGVEFAPPSAEDQAKYNIQISTWFEKKEDYIKTHAECNVFIAPRKREGIGMSFLEALSSGMVVIGHDDATLNEYVTHGLNGLLLESLAPKYTIGNATEIGRHAIHYFNQGLTNYDNKIHAIEKFIIKKSLSRLATTARHAASRHNLFQSLPPVFHLFKANSSIDAPKVSVGFVVIGTITERQLAPLLESIYKQQNVEVSYVHITNREALNARHQSRLKSRYPEIIFGEPVPEHKGTQWHVTLRPDQSLFDPFSLIDALSSVPSDAISVFGDIAIRSARGWYKHNKINPMAGISNSVVPMHNEFPIITRVSTNLEGGAAKQTKAYYSNTTIFQLAE